jgi:biopolymer transport protein ExbD
MGKRLFAFAGILLALGCVPSCATPKAPGKLIDLPVADQARDAKIDPEATVDVSLDEGRDVEATEKRIKQRVAKLRQVSREKRPSEELPPVVLRMDRDLPYRYLVAAVLAGRYQGFWKILIACKKGPNSSEVGYLIITLPTAGGEATPSAEAPPWEDDRNIVVEDDISAIRLKVATDGKKVRYTFSHLEDKSFDSLGDVLEILRSAVLEKPKALLVVDCPADLSIQRFVDVYNAGVKAGFTRLTLAMPDWERN